MNIFCKMKTSTARTVRSVIGVFLTAVMLMGSFCIPAGAAALNGIQSVMIADAGAVKNVFEGSYMMNRWASPLFYNLHDCGNGTFEIVEYRDGIIDIDSYTIDGKKTGTVTIKTELPYFGGFYSGSQYNFIFTGNENTEEDDLKTTVRVDKYTKDWKLAGRMEILGNNTVCPFDAGSLRCAEKDGYLYVHTSHEMYTSNDGLNHQANMSFSIKISDMTHIDNANDANLSRSFAYASHSFNQFIHFDGDQLVAVNHSDAYTHRAIILTRTNFKVANGRFIPRSSEESRNLKSTTEYLFVIPGRYGMNMTGVSVGGFEVTEDAYLVSISTVDHSLVEDYTHFELVGLEQEERNPIVLITEKNGLGDAESKQLVLAQYVGKNKTCSAPYLVKMDNGNVTVLWEEFNITYEAMDYVYPGYKRAVYKSCGVKYGVLDSEGNLISDIISAPKVRLAADSQPICIDGKVIWYVNLSDGQRTVYTLDTRENPFVDVKTTDPYYDAVLYVKDAGLFRGVSDTEFAPGTPMTRSMFVTVLGRLNGLKDEQMRQDERWKISDFKDVKTGEWYTPFVVWGSESGIVKGYDNGMFGIEDKITVEQAVVFIGRFCEMKGLKKNQTYTGAKSYSDYSKVSSWAQADMNWAIEEHIYQPTGKTLNPQAPASRALVAEMLYNLGYRN